MQKSAVLALAFLQQGPLLPLPAQQVGGPGGGGGGGTNQISATVTPLSPIDVPMGTEVEMRLDHAPVPNPIYSWHRKCERVWRTQPNWNTKIHKACIGVPAEMTFRGKVTSTINGVTSQGEDIQVFKFHEPDDATTVIGPLPYFNFPTPGQAEVQQQVMQTTLKWKNQNLGPCAILCYREKVIVQVSGQYRRTPLRHLRFRHSDWIPHPCSQGAFHGWPEHPNAPTLNWKSPKLYDRNWYYWSLPMWRALQTVPVGATIASRQHHYQFEGTKCDGWAWGPFNYVVWLDLVVREVKDAQGNPIPIPNSNPSRNFKVAEWRVR